MKGVIMADYIYVSLSLLKYFMNIISFVPDENLTDKKLRFLPILQVTTSMSHSQKSLSYDSHYYSPIKHSIYS